MKKKLPLILGIILLAVISIFTMSAFINQSKTTSTTKNINDYQGIRSLNIDVNSDVILKTGSEFKVESKLPAQKENVVKTKQDEIKIIERKKDTFMNLYIPSFIQNIGSFLHPSKDVTIITIPKDVRLNNLVINSDSGDVKLDQVNADRLNIDSGSGDIKLTSAQIKNNALIESDSGDVIFNELTTTTLNVNSESGDINATNLKGQKINLSSESGDVDVNNQNRTVYDKVNIDSDSGDVSIENTVIRHSEISTDSGDLNLTHSKIIDKK